MTINSYISVEGLYERPLPKFSTKHHESIRSIRSEFQYFAKFLLVLRYTLNIFKVSPRLSLETVFQTVSISLANSRANCLANSFAESRQESSLGKSRVGSYTWLSPRRFLRLFFGAEVLQLNSMRWHLRFLLIFLIKTKQ